MIVSVNGLPGKMAQLVARQIVKGDPHRHYPNRLFPHALTGPEIEQTVFDMSVLCPEFQSMSEFKIQLYPPDKRGDYLDQLLIYSHDCMGYVAAVDFTHPEAVMDNVRFYCENDIPFILGTTGVDYAEVEKLVQQSNTCAVAAPNFAIPIVLMQSAIEFLAGHCLNSLRGYRLEVVESHQAGKADTSGTAKVLVESFEALGARFVEGDSIHMVREPEVQRVMGIPEEHLGGHGWHTYTLINEQEGVKLEFTHNVNGRNVYVEGVMEALEMLESALEGGHSGEYLTMHDAIGI